jgi:hypothetical protein
MTRNPPRPAAPPCERCLLPMLPRGRVRALAQNPPAEVESDVWFCPLCGTEHARPVWCRPARPVRGGAT